MEDDLKKAVSAMGADAARALYKYLNKRKELAEQEAREGLRNLAFSTPKGMCELSKSLGQQEELDPITEQILSQYKKRGDDV
jgi:hypothetical protein